MRWLTAPPWPYGIGDAVEFIASSLAAEALVIEIDGRLAGVVGHHAPKDGNGVELGYWLARDFWGHGYMTEAAGAAVADHFRHSGEALVSGYILGNARSAQVLAKLGFRDTGQVRQLARPLGAVVTVQRMELTAKAVRRGPEKQADRDT